ncbi:MAG TPA: VOC family protein [Thermoanaerobaculia bacterium]|nr:VOC family protein [Thermoanaerobaculia bacterium]
MQDVTVDHVIVGIADLEEGLRLLTQLAGVEPQRGGQHPGRGTQNALLSLGPHTYLELIAPVGEPSEEMKFLADLHELTPIGWAVGTKDLDATKSRLEGAGFRVSAPRDGSRVRPDGQVLQWRTAALEDVPGDLTPFLIEWSAQTPHPATTSPGGCTLESVEIVGPEVERLAKLVTELRLGLVVHDGTAPQLSLTLACPAGRITLGSPDRP